MESGTQPILAAEIAAALDWWREAGVDLDFADDPSRWLAPAKVEPAAPFPRAASLPVAPEETAAAPDMLGGDRALWPAELADFAAWWLTEPSLDGGAVRNRVPPRGPHGAQLMVIVPQPESNDGESLLSGGDGRFLDAFLAAAGLETHSVYFASALPRHTPLADWAALQVRGLGDLLLHHIKLVAPQRLIFFGSSASSLLSNSPAQTGKVSHSVYHDDRTIPLLGAHELGAIAGRPKWKAAFWQRWLDWTGIETA